MVAEHLGPRLLESLYQHRMASTPQLQAMHAPGSHPGGLLRRLRVLAGAGLVDSVSLRPPRRLSVWFLTEAGAQLVEHSRPGAWGRRYLVSREAARGPLLAHTLAGNEVGLAFMAAARELGHEFGYLGWRHEVAHKLAERSGAVISDLHLHYVASGAGSAGRNIVLDRLVEVDRATMPQGTLVEKLQDYVALYRTHEQSARGTVANPPRWVQRYVTFPPVVVVFAGAPVAALRRRLRSVAELCRQDPTVGAAPLPIAFVILEELTARGPFRPVFWLAQDPVEAVDVLFDPAATVRRRAGAEVAVAG
jgi:hypothetical protein